MAPIAEDLAQIATEIKNCLKVSVELEPVPDENPETSQIYNFERNHKHYTLEVVKLQDEDKTIYNGVLTCDDDEIFDICDSVSKLIQYTYYAVDCLFLETYSLVKEIEYCLETSVKCKYITSCYNIYAGKTITQATYTRNLVKDNITGCDLLFSYERNRYTLRVIFREYCHAYRETYFDARLYDTHGSYLIDGNDSWQDIFNSVKSYLGVY